MHSGTAIASPFVDTQGNSKISVPLMHTAQDNRAGTQVMPQLSSFVILLAVIEI